jgi:hypothetical protein
VGEREGELGADFSSLELPRHPQICCSKSPESFIEQGLRDAFRVPQFPAMRLTVRLYGPTYWGHTPRARSLTARTSGYATVAAAIR